MAFKLSNFRYVPYVYRWSKEVDPILPEHYKQRCKEFMEGQPLAVHWIPDTRQFTVNKRTGERERIQNIPVKVIYPLESNNGLWGGEGIVVGLRKRRFYSSRTPKLWKPYLTKRPIYSEIFNQFYLITVTLRTLDLIDEYYGFDNYILKTDEVNLNSQLGMKFKREMLTALATKSFYPDQPEKQSKILQRYEKFLIPEEEAEWVGLSASQAVHKALSLYNTKNPTRPMKELFIDELASKSNEPDFDDSDAEKSWLNKINIFSSKSSEAKA